MLAYCTRVVRCWRYSNLKLLMSIDPNTTSSYRSFPGLNPAAAHATTDGRKCSMRGWAFPNVCSWLEASSFRFLSSVRYLSLVSTSWNQFRNRWHQSGFLAPPISCMLWVDWPLPMIRTPLERRGASDSPRLMCSRMFSPFLSDNWNTEIKFKSDYTWIKNWIYEELIWYTLVPR